MALFRRNKTEQAGVPAEVQDYYQAEGRQRTWVAWVLAVATLFVTVVVVLAIFIGGRWTYRKLKDSDKPAPVAVQQDTAPDASKASTATSDTNSTPPQTSSTSTNQPSSPSQTSNPSAVTKNSDLPKTGPGDTLAVFALACVIGYLAHRRFLAN